MSDETQVDPAELRASAKAADAIADDLKGPASKAVKEADTAGGSFSGWSFGSALQEISTSWKPALDGLEARARAGAANLRSSADGHEWNDERTGKDFENLGAQGATTQATPGEMPAALRRPGEGNDTPASQGRSPLDPRTPSGTNMPTYEGSPVSTRPTAGENPFG
ncbi:type VII secretion target [Streptomyces sp. NPDC001904]|uniref:type VII secretion target n=1 Tax=Streptomyces sp. NPDC001904 TaxID=3154531 RepID=UPI00332C9461